MTLAALGVALVALALRFWCQVILVRHGIVTPIERALPTQPKSWAREGPYRYLHHPIYAANLVFIAAVGVAALGPGGVLLALPALPYYQGRIAEEDALRGED